MTGTDDCKGGCVAKKNKAPLKSQAQGHMERLEELDEGHPLREKPRGARGEHLPHDSDAEKRDFSAAERRRAAREGASLPDGSFPVYNQDDLDNAVHLAGHAKDPRTARRHISARARALGLKDPYGKESMNTGPHGMRD